MKRAVLTPVRVGIMERKRPEEVTSLHVRHLRWFERLWRGAKRGLVVMGVLLLVGNVALILMPAPHLHLCLFPIAFVLGPLVAIFSARDRVLFAAGEVVCPKCQKVAMIPDALGGWPARFNCEHCSAMVEFNPP